MALAKDSLSEKAMGGTELLKYELVRRMNERDPDLLQNFQIFVSRVHEEVSKDKIVIYWLHDLAEDPAAGEELKNGRWKRFDLLVFVSNWQMQRYIDRYKLPWSKCVVLENCINPINVTEPKDNSKIKLIYTPTPHRGLELLIPVFEHLQNKYPDKLQLDVFSSFKLYGWETRDKPYEPLFERCRSNPDIIYHGSAPNETVRETLKQSHIFAYPSIWQETSCLCLIEAMSAKNICVHPNYGALADTSGGITLQYQWREDPRDHAQAFLDTLDHAIQRAQSDDVEPTLIFQKLYADTRFSWDVRAHQWYNLLASMEKAKEFIIQARAQATDPNVFRVVT